MKVAPSGASDRMVDCPVTVRLRRIEPDATSYTKRIVEALLLMVLSPMMNWPSGERPDFGPREYADDRPGVEEWMLHRVQVNGLHQAIDALPSRQRQAIVMHKFEGVDCKQIACRMECTPQAVRSMLVRAYDAMRLSMTELVGC